MRIYYPYISSTNAHSGVFTHVGRGHRVQGIDRKKLVYHSLLQPGLAIWGLFWTSLFILINGFEVFFPGHWNTSDFFVAYINIPIFFILFLGWKFYRRTKFWRAHEMDFWRVSAPTGNARSHMLMSFLHAGNSYAGGDGLAGGATEELEGEGLQHHLLKVVCCVTDTVLSVLRAVYNCTRICCCAVVPDTYLCECIARKLRHLHAYDGFRSRRHSTKPDSPTNVDKLVLLTHADVRAPAARLTRRAIPAFNFHQRCARI